MDTFFKPLKPVSPEATLCPFLKPREKLKTIELKLERARKVK